MGQSRKDQSYWWMHNPHCICSAGKGQQLFPYLDAKLTDYSVYPKKFFWFIEVLIEVKIHLPWSRLVDKWNHKFPDGVHQLQLKASLKYTYDQNSVKIEQTTSWQRKYEKKKRNSNPFERFLQVEQHQNNMKAYPKNSPTWMKSSFPYRITI